jgi:Acetyltransferase (GNAT) family
VEEAPAARGWPIVVRMARPEDRAAVLSFASTTWNGSDYIPEVWDDWVVPSEGVMLVATVGAATGGQGPRDLSGRDLQVGQPVAMSRVTMLSPTEAWLEGIRVDPRVRGMGVATDLQVAELQWVAAHQAKVVRYITGAANVASQRLGAHHGLLELGRWRTHGSHADAPAAAAAWAATTEARLERLDHADEHAWDRVSGDAAYAQAQGLYEYRPWAFQELTGDRFARHVARGEVLTATRGPAWAALIVNRALLVDGRVQVAFACGDGAALLDLLVRLERPAFGLPDPDPAVLAGHEAEFAAQGLAPQDRVRVVVQRLMDSRDAIPGPGDGERLRLGDPPHAICVPPSLDP